MHTKEEIKKHFKNNNELDARIRFRKWKYWSIIAWWKKDISEITSGYSSIIEEKNTEISWWLMTYLENNQLPSDIVFHAYGPEKYFNITHNTTSPYSVLYDWEIQMLLELVNNKTKYVHKNIIDIWCGDGIKVYEMLQEWIKNKKIDWTVDYLGLDDSQDMLDFAKKKFYDNFYSKSKNEAWNLYIPSDDIDIVNKKIRPWFKKARFQAIKWLENRTPKTILFLWWTFGNLSTEIQKSFLEDIKNMMQPWDTFVISYFRILDNKPFDNEYTKELVRDFFEREKKRYEDHNVYYAEKEIDIANLKKSLPWIEIWQDDFDIHMELDEEYQILYDVRIFKKDIFYAGEIAIPKWTSYKSEGTKIDQETLKKEIYNQDITKNFVESLYRTQETKDFINDFFKSKWVDPKDIFIEVEYTPEDSKLHINIIPLRPITLVWKENNIKKSITKYPTDVIKFHESRRFKDQNMEEIVEESWLHVVDHLWCKSILAWQDIMKILIIKK